jgi:tetratricopeptide (TPR) repeat protein
MGAEAPALAERVESVRRLVRNGHCRDIGGRTPSDFSLDWRNVMGNRHGHAFHFLVLAAACALVAALSSVAAAGEIVGRERALRALKSPDPSARREAVLELGKVGRMADADALLDALYDDDEGVRGLAEAAVWQVWSRSGDARADALLKSGIGHMEQGQMGAAVEDFTRVIEMHPEFAEGWNKRATAYFLMGDLEQSLRDCDEVMRRNPNHFGALSGYGLIHVQRGDLERALEYFERALEINPNLHGVQQTIELILYKLGREGKRSI